MSTKNSFLIIIVLVAYFNLELHQIEVKKAFLNGNLYKKIYMRQPESFQVEGKGHIVCKLQKSIFGLK